MKKYIALTLLELIIVMVVIFILSLVSVVAYRSLIDSFSINEVSLTIAQDIRRTQRAAMLLDREADERWLHGIGIDFREIENREYSIFKWCSRHDYYDENKQDIAGEIPNVGSNLPLVDSVESCPRREYGADNVYYKTQTRDFRQYDNLDFELQNNVTFILFESVSGKAFLYNNNGELLNYLLPDVIRVDDNSLQLFDLEIRPMRAAGLASRSIRVAPVSGIAYFEYDE